jgi:serine/threonine protein kinase
VSEELEFDFATPAAKDHDFTFLDLDSKVDLDDTKIDSWDPTIPGTRFGDYQVTGFLGHGAMAQVMKGRHVTTKERVAIKVLRKRLDGKAAIRERFRREAVAIARVRHPNIIDSFAYGIAHRHPFLVLEHLEGGTVGDLLKRRKKKGKLLPVDFAVELTLMLLAGLQAAHEAQLLHRDIKPDNLLFDLAGRVKLADFGLVKLGGGNDQSITMTGAVLGTPRYMAPEQCKASKDADARSDLYAVGVTLFQLLTNELPFTAHTPIAQYAEQKAAPAPKIRTRRKEVPRTLEYFVARLLEFDPERRYPTAKAAREELRKALPLPRQIRVLVIQDEKSIHDGKLTLGEKLVLGRAPEAGVTVSGNGLSRFHCQLEYTSRGLTAVDLGSTNGTWIGRKRIEAPTQLARRTGLRLGKTRLALRWQGG